MFKCFHSLSNCSCFHSFKTFIVFTVSYFHTFHALRFIMIFMPACGFQFARLDWITDHWSTLAVRRPAVRGPSTNPTWMTITRGNCSHWCADHGRNVNVALCYQPWPTLRGVLLKMFLTASMLVLASSNGAKRELEAQDEPMTSTLALAHRQCKPTKGVQDRTLQTRQRIIKCICMLSVLSGPQGSPIYEAESLGMGNLA
jgi:hypothetical protein